MAVGKYRLRDGEALRMTRVIKASGTVIEAGDLVAIDTGLAIKAVAASTAVAWCPNGGADGETVIEVSVGNDFTLLTSGEAVFAVAYKGGEYDINDTTQTIDWNGTTYKVLKIDVSEDAGVVGSASDITVRINKPLF
jgi:hypothetical protein